MAQKINGSDLMLFIGGKSIALATNHTLEISGDTQSTSNKDEGGSWASEEVSLLHWSGTTENLFSPDGEGNLYNDLYDIMIAKSPVAATFTLKKEAGNTVPTGGWTPITTVDTSTAMTDNIYSGNIAITSLTLNAPNGEYATFTMNFTGVGPLTRVQ